MFCYKHVYLRNIQKEMALKSKLIKLLGLADATELENRLKPAKSKIWKALLNQTGTDAPVATVLQSDFDESDITISYDAPGLYKILIPGMTETNTIVTFSTDGNGYFWFVHKAGVSGADVAIFTAASCADADNLVTQDELLSHTPICIEMFV